MTRCYHICSNELFWSIWALYKETSVHFIIAKNICSPGRVFGMILLDKLSFPYTFDDIADKIFKIINVLEDWITKLCDKYKVTCMIVYIFRSTEFVG